MVLNPKREKELKECKNKVKVIVKHGIKGKGINALNKTKLSNFELDEIFGGEFCESIGLLEGQGEPRD